jgi:hypothetical protein
MPLQKRTSIYVGVAEDGMEICEIVNSVIENSANTTRQGLVGISVVQLRLGDVNTDK